MSTIYETAVETVRDTGERLAREIPGRLPSGDWPDDVVERVADELMHGFDVVKEAVVPVASVAVGAGTNAALSGRRTAGRHPLLMIGGGVALVALVVWLVRRRRSGADERPEVYGVPETRRPSTVA